jgi:hypothetical protein
MTGLFITVLAAVVVATWWQLMRGRERARVVAKACCKRHGLQLLDDTVSLQGIQRAPADSRSLVRVRYGFEFTMGGALRQRGAVDIGLPETLTISFETPEGLVIEHFTGERNNRR